MPFFFSTLPPTLLSPYFVAVIWDLCRKTPYKRFSTAVKSPSYGHIEESTSEGYSPWLEFSYKQVQFHGISLPTMSTLGRCPPQSSVQFERVDCALLWTMTVIWTYMTWTYNQSEMLCSTAQRYVNHQTRFKLGVHLAILLASFAQILPVLESCVVHGYMYLM